MANIVVERFWHHHFLCQLLSCSIKGIASVTANQAIEKHQNIFCCFGSVKELMHRNKTFQIDVCSCSSFKRISNSQKYLACNATGKPPKGKCVWPGNVTTKYYRPTHGTTRKIQRTLATRNTEHTKAPSSLFPNEMIAKLERTKSYCKTKQAYNITPHKHWSQQQTMNKQKQNNCLPGRVAQSVTCLATDASLTADPGVASSIPARYHTFVEIDHEIISTAFSSLPLIIQEGLLSVTSESMCTNYWLTACSSLPRIKCG